MTVTCPVSPLARLAAVFEDGRSLLEQACAVLRACPDAEVLADYGVSDPADLPAGAADRCLLAASVALTGAPVEVTAGCAACGCRSTFALTPESVGAHAWVCRVTSPGRGLREPTYADLVGCAGDRSALLEACRIGLGPGGSPPGGDGRGADGAEATGSGGDGSGEWVDLEAIDASLSGPLRSACVECGADLVLDLDVVTLVLASLARVCADVDREVHLLASAYGWELATIEGLPDHRRQRLAALVSGVAG